jgi:hypothetical protein
LTFHHSKSKWEKETHNQKSPDPELGHLFRFSEARKVIGFVHTSTCV